MLQCRINQLGREGGVVSRRDYLEQYYSPLVLWCFSSQTNCTVWVENVPCLKLELTTL